MEPGLTAETDEFAVTLRELATTKRGGEEVTVLLFEVENTSDSVERWEAEKHVFLDDGGFQYRPAGIVTTTGSSSSDNPFESESPEHEIELHPRIETSTQIVPGARVLCVTDVQLPPHRELQRIFYDYDESDCQYKFDLTDENLSSVSVPLQELGMGDKSGTAGVAGGSEERPRGEIGIGTSTNFEVELTHVVQDIPDEDPNLTVLTFDVKNVGTESKKWWYDEHVFIDSEGYRLSEADQAASRLSFDGVPMPDGYESAPRIPPGASAKCFTDVNLAADRQILEIYYEYDDERYELAVTEEMWGTLTISHEEFMEDRVSVGEEVDERVSAMVVEDSPTTTYDDIGGLVEQKRKVREAIREPLVRPEQFEQIGITPPEGVLLYGPPGTGKTMLARAVANDADATFIKLAAPELARAFLGEGAELVRDCFEYARSRRPAIIFIDEIDAIAARRRGSAQGATEEIYRTMLQLLSEMDGFEEDEDVRVLAATNRINRLDEAILRPGRFDRIIEVPLPDQDGLKEILAVHTEGMATADELDLDELSRRAEGMSGAEVEAVCTEAGYTAIRDGRDVVRQQDFIEALQEIRREMEPSESSKRYLQ